MDGAAFEKEHIMEWYQKIQDLKNQYDEAERDCGLINKREALLGNKKTDFMDLAVIKDDLTPLYALWTVSNEFARTFPKWIEGRFDLLDAGKIEGQTEDWLKELQRLQKSVLVANNEKQKELQEFMFKGLNHFKKYGQMLRTLRTKGLASRHWRDISNQLGIQIDPSAITLYVLIKHELYNEEKLKTIKEICEVATKEYAVQMALESLDKEMKAVEFLFQNSPSPSGISEFDTQVVAKLPEIII